MDAGTQEFGQLPENPKPGQVVYGLIPARSFKADWSEILFWATVCLCVVSNTLIIVVCLMFLAGGSP